MATTTNTTKATTATTTATTTAKATTAKAKAPTYAAKALPTTATQYRHASGGPNTAQAKGYQTACRVLAKWAKGTPNAAQVHALVHLGWCAGAGSRANCQASNSVAYKAAAHLLKPGAPAGPQLVATLATLAKAGAPAPALAVVWATVTGTAKA